MDKQQSLTPLDLNDLYPTKKQIQTETETIKKSDTGKFLSEALIFA